MEAGSWEEDQAVDTKLLLFTLKKRADLVASG